MKRLLKKMLAEWEKTLFWVFLICLVAVLSAGVLGMLREQEGVTGSIKGSPPGRSLLGSRALAFLSPLESATLEGGNPFTFIRRLQEFNDKVRRPWQTKRPDLQKPVEKPVERPDPIAAVAPSANAAPDQTAAPVTPKASPDNSGKKLDDTPPPTRIVQYKGIHIGPSGTALAYVSCRDQNTKKTHSGFRKVGEDAGGVTVESFDEHSLHVKVPGQERSETIPIGGRKKIELE